MNRIAPIHRAFIKGVTAAYLYIAFCALDLFWWKPPTLGIERAGGVSLMLLVGALMCILTIPAQREWEDRQKREVGDD